MGACHCRRAPRPLPPSPRAPLALGARAAAAQAPAPLSNPVRLQCRARCHGHWHRQGRQRRRHDRPGAAEGAQGGRCRGGSCAGSHRCAHNLSLITACHPRPHVAARHRVCRRCCKTPPCALTSCLPACCTCARAWRRPRSRHRTAVCTPPLALPSPTPRPPTWPPRFPCTHGRAPPAKFCWTLVGSGTGRRALNAWLGMRAHLQSGRAAS